jgi:preprotein translocase SecE subunit
MADRPSRGENDADLGDDVVRDDDLEQDLGDESDLDEERVRDDDYERDFGQSEPPDPLGQAEPAVTEAHLAEQGPDRTRRRSRAERAERAERAAAAGRAGNELQQSAVPNGESTAVEEHHHSNEPVHPRKGLFGRAADFLRASYAELRRVQWPDRRQVGQGTAVTMGFVIVAGAYLGLLDAIWNPIIQAIL